MSLEIIVSLNGRLPFLDSGPIGLEISLELLGIIVFKVDLTPNYLTRSSFRKFFFGNAGRPMAESARSGRPVHCRPPIRSS